MVVQQWNSVADATRDLRIEIAYWLRMWHYPGEEVLLVKRSPAGRAVYRVRTPSSEYYVRLP